MKYLALGDIVEILDSKRRPISKKDRKHGPFPYYGATGIVDYIDGYIFDEELVLVGEDGAKWKSMDKTAFIIKGKTWVNNHAHVLKPNNEIVLNQFCLDFVQMDKVSRCQNLLLNQDTVHRGFRRVHVYDLNASLKENNSAV